MSELLSWLRDNIYIPIWGSFVILVVFSVIFPFVLESLKRIFGSLSFNRRKIHSKLRDGGKLVRIANSGQFPNATANGIIKFNKIISTLLREKVAQECGVITNPEGPNEMHAMGTFESVELGPLG